MYHVINHVTNSALDVLGAEIVVVSQPFFTAGPWHGHD